MTGQLTVALVIHCERKGSLIQLTGRIIWASYGPNGGNGKLPLVRGAFEGRNQIPECHRLA
jgi:hypothetical protein